MGFDYILKRRRRRRKQQNPTFNNIKAQFLASNPKLLVMY